MEYFFHVVLCEISACFIGCFLSILIGYFAFNYRFDTKETTLKQTKKLMAVYVLCIPLTALSLCVLNHCFLPIEVNMTVPGYPQFWPSITFYCGIVLRYCIVFFVVDVFINHHRRTKQELAEIREINEMLKSYQEKQSTKSSIKSLDEHKVCKIMSQNSGQGLSFDPQELIYVESVANYAEVCYMCNDEIRRLTLRSTLKQIKESVCVYDFIIQCHRGFIVNLNFVISLQCENNSFFLNLFCVEKKIPVSRAKKNDIKTILSALQHE